MQANPLQDVMIRACSDPALRARFLKDPVAVLAEAGIAVPQGVEVVVHEAADHYLPLVLPGRGTGPAKPKTAAPSPTHHGQESVLEMQWHSGVLYLTGRVDVKTAPKLKTALLDATKAFDVDCSGVTFLSSAGLASLLVAQKAHAAKGNPIRLTNVSTEIRNVLELSGFEKLFEISDIAPPHQS